MATEPILSTARLLEALDVLGNIYPETVITAIQFDGDSIYHFKYCINHDELWQSIDLTLFLV